MLFRSMSPLTDGTYRYSHTQQASNRKSWTENGNNYSVYSNTYDSSFLRHVMLGLSDDAAFRANYAKEWGSFWNALTNKRQDVSGSRVNVPDANQLNKFRLITQGALSQYVVAPNQVSWQMGQNKYPNDPAWSNAQSAYYPTNWTGDKIWMPSRTDFEASYWNLNANQRSYKETFTTRSATAGNYVNMLIWLDTDGTTKVGDWTCESCMPLRPAFHLNLSMIAEYFIDRKSVG